MKNVLKILTFGTIVIYGILVFMTEPDYGLYKDDWRWDTVRNALLEYGTDSAVTIWDEMGE